MQLCIYTQTHTGWGISHAYRCEGWSLRSGDDTHKLRQGIELVT